MTQTRRLSMIGLVALLFVITSAFALQAQDTATPIAPGDNVTGTLDEDMPRALYSLSVDASTTVTITLESSDFDSYLLVLDEAEVVVAEDDDSAGRLNSELELTLDAGEYTIVATSLREYRSEGELFSSGDYTLTLSSDNEASAEATEESVVGQPVTDIAIGDSLVGGLTEDEPRHEYTLTVEAGDGAAITLVSTEFDPYLILLDSAGVEVARDDDSAGSLDSLIEIGFADAGEYTVIVSSFGEVNDFVAGFGQYDLTVESADIEAQVVQATPTFVPSPTPIEPLPTVDPLQGGVDRGVIEAGQVVEDALTETELLHEWSFEAQAGDIISVDLSSDDFDTYVLLFDANDEEVARNDDGGEGLNSLIDSFEIPADGTYTIYASSYGHIRNFTAGVGDYTLALVEGTVAVVEVTPTIAPTQPVTTTEFDYSGEEQGEITFGDTVVGSLSEDTPAHTYTFEASTGDIVSIELTAGFDTYLVLLDENGDVLEVNDDGGEGLNSLITGYEILADGTYTIYASSYGNVLGFIIGEGRYNLTFVAGEVAIAQVATPTLTPTFPITPTLAPFTPTPLPDTFEADEDLVVAVPQGDIAVNETVTSSLIEDEYAHGYTFSAAVGDQITISVEGDFDTYLVLRNSTNETVTFNDDGGEGLNSQISQFIIPATDTYTVIVSSYSFVRQFGEEIGEYTLTLSDSEDVVDVTPTAIPETGEEIVEMGTITPGTYTGELGNGLGQAHEYTFSGNAGDLVTITVTADDFDTQLFLFDLDYLTVASNDDADDISLGLSSQLVDIELPETGDYIIGVTSFDWVEGADNVAGEYTLELISTGDTVVQVTPTMTPVVDPPPIDNEVFIGSVIYGDSFTGALSEAGGLAHLYTFNGTVTDMVTVDLSSEILDTYLILRFEDGTELSVDDDGGEGLNSRIEDFELPASGEYTIVASTFGYVRGFTPGEGDYTLTLTSSSSEFVSDPTEIVIGDTIFEFLDENEAVNAYELFAQAGDQVVITLTSEEFDTYLLLFDENGNEINRDDDSAGNLDSRIGPFSIPEDGLYTVQVTSYQNVVGSSTGAFGSYVLTVEAIDPQPVEYTQTVEGTINDGESTLAIYSFTGEAGDLVSVNFSSTSQSAYILLQGEGINQQTFGGNNVLGPVTLPADGDYTLTVTTYDTFEPDQAFSFSIDVIDPVSVTYGDEIDANFDDATVLYYEFEGEAGDAINAVVNSDGSVDTTLTIISPEGYDLYFDDDSGAGFDPEVLSIMLPIDGTYTVVIRPYISGDNGDFTFMVDATGTPPIDTQTQVIRLSDKQRMAGVVFEAEAGETVRVSVRLLTPNNSEPRITISQDGAVLASNTVGQVSRLLLELTIEEDGQVLVEANDVNFIGAILELSIERLDE